MPKTRDAFAFRDFNKDEILQRNFFSSKEFVSRILSGTLFEQGEMSDKAFLESCCDADNCSAKRYDDICQQLKRGVGYLSDYYNRIQKHIGKLEKFSVTLADKILIADEQNEKWRKWRTQYRRAKELITEYEKIALAVETLGEEVRKAHCIADSKVSKLYRREFAVKLKDARHWQNITQSQLATELNLTTVAYQYYESAKREPSLTNLIRLSRILNVTPNLLLGFE